MPYYAGYDDITLALINWANRTRRFRMPYKVEKGHGCPSSKPYALVKKSDGKVLGCHESMEKAQSQMRAVHANELKKQVK